LFHNVAVSFPEVNRDKGRGDDPKEKKKVGMAGNKIVKLKLQKTVEDFISNGITTATAISQQLKSMGYDISQPTVSRYLSNQQPDRKEETQRIVTDHVRENVPADLTALEDMERQCLDWASENRDAFAHRLADQHIANASITWVEKILRLSGDDRTKAIKDIISQCLGWIADDIRLQGAKITAMRQASSIIEMKLRFSLGDGHDGSIIFMDRERGDQLQHDTKTGRMFVIPGGAS